MKKSGYLFAMMFVAVAMSGCSSLASNSASDDMYSTHNRVAIAQRQAAEAELAKAQALAEKARYEQLLAEREAKQAEEAYYNSLRSGGNRGTTLYADNDDVVVIADSKYARRIYMFDNNDIYILPSDYYRWSYSPYDYYYNVPPRYWNSYWNRWGWSVSGPGWSFYWNSSPWYCGWYDHWHYDPWYVSCHYGWHNPYWYNPHYHHHYPSHGPSWPGWGPGAGSGGPHYAGNRPSHQPGYRTFDNGYRSSISYRQPSVTGSHSSSRGPVQNSGSSNGGNKGSNNGNYQNSRPSRSDFLSPSRPSNNNSSSSSRAESNSSNSNRQNSSSSSSSSPTYRRGSGSSSYNSSRPTYSSGSSSSSRGNSGFSSGGSYSSGGSSHSSGGSGSGRSAGGR